MQRHLKLWQKNVVAVTFSATVFAASTQPIFAADNLFQQVQQTITGQFEKMYLQFVPGNKPGKLVLKQMATASQNLKSFMGKTTVDVALLSDSEQVGTANFTATGPTVMAQPWNPESYQQDLTVSGTAEYQGQTLTGAGNIKLSDGVSYIQFTQLPDIEGVKLSSLLNTWVKFAPATETAPLTTDQQAEVQAAFFQMINESNVSSATVEQKDGHSVYVLTATISQPALAKYLDTVQRVSGGESQPSSMKSLSQLEELKATLWVDKTTFYPRRIELPIMMKMSTAANENSATAQLPVPTTLRPQNLSAVEVNVVSDLTDHNSSFTLSVPENAEDSQVFFTRVMSLFMPGLTDMMQMSAAANSRRPTEGTTELPQMNAEQRKALEQYERMMRTTLPMPKDFE